MKKLLIELTAPKDHPFPVLSWAIRLLQWNKEDGIPKFSHARWRWYTGKYDEHLVYEASGAGLKFIGGMTWPKHATVIEAYEIDVMDDCKDKIVKWCIAHAGIKYSKMGLIGLIYVVLVKFICSKRVKNPFKDGEYSQVCVEAIVRGFEELCIETGIDPDSADLLDVRNVLRHYAAADEPRIRRVV